MRLDAGGWEGGGVGWLPRLQVHKPVGLLAQPITTISVTMTKVTDTDANAFYCPAQRSYGNGSDLEAGLLEEMQLLREMEIPIPIPIQRLHATCCKRG